MLMIFLYVGHIPVADIIICHITPECDVSDQYLTLMPALDVGDVTCHQHTQSCKIFRESEPTVLASREPGET